VKESACKTLLIDINHFIGIADNTVLHFIVKAVPKASHRWQLDHTC